MKVFVSIGRFAESASSAELRDLVRQLEDAGLTGVTMWDHMFHSLGQPRAETTFRPGEPLTTLAAVAGMSDHLELMTGVMNSEWIHPALLLRQFSQLAVMAGGSRVTAGLGAGWNKEEFDALGMTMAPLPRRLDRLEESLSIARQLYDRGFADLEGEFVTVKSLPVCPLPPSPPRLLIGGGSDRIMEMAGRYCDIVDVHGAPRNGGMTGKTEQEKHLHDRQRRALTTVDDIAERLSVSRSAARDVGRDPLAVTASVFVMAAASGSPSEIARREEAICSEWGLAPMSLADNPYYLLGEPARVADTLIERKERAGLSQIILHDEAMTIQDYLEFGRTVIPQLLTRA